MSDAEMYRLGIALEPLGLLHSEGWGPNEVEVTENEVRFVYER